jgi:HSP20 family protein
MKFEGGVYKVIAEVPGVDRGDIHIDVEGNTLTLRGEKKAEFDEETGQCHCSERYYGSFERTFDLPSDARADEIEAHLDKGVLTISVPVESGEKHGKKIEVTVN